MIGLAQADRWTCPTCNGTEVPDVPTVELHEAIRAAQLQHICRAMEADDAKAATR